MRQSEVEWMEDRPHRDGQLFDDTNRALGDLLWRCLSSVQTPALVSGEHLYHVAPIVELVTTAATYREDRTKSPDGTVFLSQLQHLAVKYGALSEYIPAAPVARVLEADLPVLAAAGAACWDSVHRTKQPIRVRVRRAGVEAPSYFPSFGPIAASEGQALLDDVVAELRHIWLEPPEEVLDIHAGRIESGAGSAGQWFSTLVFVNGETRPLGYAGFGGLMQVCRDPEISLDVLRRITRSFIRVPAEFLGYCGLRRLWDFVDRALGVLPALRDKDEYFALVSALGLYTNQLNAWNLHHFPWDAGAGAFRFNR